jgi:hypothetical protein
MIHELGLTSKKNLTPYLRSLEEKRFISTKLVSGKRFYLMHDPRVAIEQFLAQKKLSDDELQEINDLYEDLGQPLVPGPKPGKP